VELTELDARGRRLRAALAALLLKADAPELRLMHRCLDSWSGVGLVAVGIERLGYRLALTHIGDEEWRATFSDDPRLAAAGFGVAPTPWSAVQRAAWGALHKIAV
jgi:hypothetical protein